MRPRIGQHGNDLRKADERIGVAVGEDEGEWVVPLAELMDEVNAKAVHGGSEVREAIDGLFLAPPIEAGQPVV